MLKILFDRYKYVALAVLFVVYSVGVWNVSSKVTDNAYLRTALNRSEEIIRIKTENDDLVRKVTKEFHDELKALGASQELHQKAIEDALKDPRYTQCTTTDSVRELYKRKLNAK